MKNKWTESAIREEISKLDKKLICTKHGCLSVLITHDVPLECIHLLTEVRSNSQIIIIKILIGLLRKHLILSGTNMLTIWITFYIITVHMVQLGNTAVLLLVQCRFAAITKNELITIDRNTLKKKVCQNAMMNTTSVILFFIQSTERVSLKMFRESQLAE